MSGDTYRSATTATRHLRRVAAALLPTLWLIGETAALSQTQSGPPAAAAREISLTDDGIAAAERRLRPLTITITTALDFARLTTDGGGGVLSVDPLAGTAQPRGAVRALSGLAFAGRGEVTGEPGRGVRIQLPEAVTLYGPAGARVTVRNLRTDLPPAARLDESGRLSFAFGGDLEVSGAVDGQFRGAIRVTVDYL